MAISAQPPLQKRIGRPPTPILPETPVERFEGEGIEIGAECVLYRDHSRAKRLAADKRHDDKLEIALQIAEERNQHDIAVLIRGAMADDAEEDAWADDGDDRVIVRIHMHAKCLTAMAVETEMGGVPLTTRERLPKLYSRRRRGQRGTGR